MTARFWLMGCLLIASFSASGAAQTRDLASTWSSARTPGRWRDATLDEYRSHLVALQVLTVACAKARDLKTCDPTLVGPDDRVPFGPPSNGERRLVRYGWLRILFSRAEEPDDAQTTSDAPLKSAQPGQTLREDVPTASRLLNDARERLVHDLAQAGSAAAPPLTYSAERDAMRMVLEGRQFRDLQQPTQADAALETIGNWLNRQFEKLDKLRARSAWVGRILVWGFFSAVTLALAGLLMRMERRWRRNLVPLTRTPLPGAATARDWQQWLADAHKAEAEAQWRNAIHYLYWAVILHLESRRAWPADRARTPREYLTLVAPEDSRQAGLASLTRCFERIWYGGRTANESDYRLAETLAGALIIGGGTWKGNAR